MQTHRSAPSAARNWKLCGEGEVECGMVFALEIILSRLVRY
jgi:hypothetical protein